MIRRVLPSLLLLAAAVPAFAGEGKESAPGGPPVPWASRPADPRGLGIGDLVPDLAATDLEGNEVRLSSFRDRRGVAVAFFGPSCPVSRRYAPELGRLGNDLAGRGIPLLVVNAAGPGAVEDLRAAAKAQGWTMPVLPDPDRALAKALGARTTTEAFLLDPARTLVYRGAVDDRYGLGYAQDAARHLWLRDAVDALLAGRAPAVPATDAPGCLLGAEDPRPAAGAPTWHGSVSRILRRSCMECHRAGENAPFPLTTRAEVEAQAAMVEFMVERRAMPPWFAGEGSLPMASDRSLPDRDREALLAWLRAGMPEGDPADAPLPPSWTRGWRIGEPDLVVEAPLQQVPAEGTVPYRHLTVATEVREDRWVRGLEVRVTEPRVVHHVLVFLKYPKDHPRAAEQRKYRGGLEGYFAAMVPGQEVLLYPEGQAKFLPAGATLVFQVHYTTDGTAREDRPRLGLKFADGPPEREVRSQGIYNLVFVIPPGAKRHPVQAIWRAPRPGRVLAFMPHMHVRGAAFRYEVRPPGGEWTTVLDVPRYDFNWQLVYRLREPLALAEGTEIRATGWFDNSPENPANPDPAKPVVFGEQTWEEMMIGYIEWVAD